MSYPANLDTIVVRHKIVDTGGKPMKGNSVRAVATKRIWATDGSLIPFETTARVQADGSYEFELPYVDQDGIHNKGVPFQIIEDVPGKPRHYFIAPVLAHGTGPIDATEALVEAPVGYEVKIQAGPVTDATAAQLLDQDGQFKAALTGAIATETEPIARSAGADAAVQKLAEVPEVAQEAATRAVSVAADPAIAGAFDDPTSLSSQRVIRVGELVDSAAKYGVRPDNSAAANTTALRTALATGRPMLLPGGPGTIYPMGELNQLHLRSGGQILGNGATIKATGAAFLHFVGLTDFTIDGLTIDGDARTAASLRFTDCHNFTLGSLGVINGLSRGIHFEGCTGWHADTLIADNNGRSGQTLGSGIYLTDHNGQGNTGFSIGVIRGSGNGLGTNLDGQTFHTNGQVRGQVGQLYATNNTRYGAKIQHTSGHLNIGQIYAVGNQRNVSVPAVNGLTIGALYSQGATVTGLWLDAACKNVNIGQAVIVDTGGKGVEVVEGAEDITWGSLVVKRSGLTSGGFAGVGVDILGATRLHGGRTVVTDAGHAADPAPYALRVVASASNHVTFDDMLLTDTRTGTERATRPAHFGIPTWPQVSIGNFIASGFQFSLPNGMTSDIAPRAISGTLRTRNQGTATILSGQTSVVVEHGLLAPPVRAHASGSVGETANAYVWGINSTSFQIRVPAATTGDRPVYWTAEM